MEKLTFPESINRTFRALLRECFFIKPGVVTKVHDFTVDVLPLTTTKYKDEEQLKSPEAFDVPLMIYSGNKGKARITVPIKEGDTVLLLYSDRDFGDLLENRVQINSAFPGDSIDPCSGHPIMAIPEFFTDIEGTPIDKDNIVIENQKTKIIIEPDGNIILDTPGDLIANVAGDSNITTGGSANITTGGTATVTAPEKVMITTPLAEFSGVVKAVEVIASTRVVAPVLAPSEGSQNNFYDHIHNENDNGGPTGPPIYS